MCPAVSRGCGGEKRGLDVKTAFPEVIVLKLRASLDPALPSRHLQAKQLSDISARGFLEAFALIKNTLERRKVGWKKPGLARHTLSLTALGAARLHKTRDTLTSNRYRRICK